MTIDEIKKLIEVVRETGIAELEVQMGDTRVRISAPKTGSQEMVLPPVLPIALQATAAAPLAMPAPLSAPAAHALATAAAEAPQPAAPEKPEEPALLVKSPIVGTYYDSPSPGSPPFVKVGDRVEPKQVLCIIESMKLMNEIEAETAGVIVAKHVENGRPVEYGESLFSLRPA